MKPSAFDYHAPTTLSEALDELGAHGDDGRALAGGQSLVPLLALRRARYRHLVDLNGIEELSSVTVEAGSLRIGAMTRQVGVERSDEVARHAPLLRRATRLVGNAQVRNRGTLGGSLAQADPAAEYPATALALDAQMEIAGPSGRRTVAAADFFRSPGVTCLEPAELLLAMRIPLRSGRVGSAIDEVGRRHEDYAIVGAACTVVVGADDRITEAYVALFGVDGTPVRAVAAEAAILGHAAGDIDSVDRREIGELAIVDIDPPDDLHAAGDYRRQVAAVLVARVLYAALREATNG